MTSRFFTKPTVAIRYDSDGCRVILGRAETIPNDNHMDADTKQRIIDAVEDRYPQIQAYIEPRSNCSMVAMSRAAQRACGATPTEIEEFIRTVAMPER